MNEDLLKILPFNIRKNDPMDDLEFRRKSLIKDIVDNPLFDSMIKGIKDEIAAAMLATEKEEERDRLYHDAQALTRLQGQLVKIANDIRIQKHG